MLTGHTNAVWDLAVHNQQNYLLSCSADGSCRIWNPTIKMSLINTYPATKGKVWDDMVGIIWMLYGICHIYIPYIYGMVLSIVYGMVLLCSFMLFAVTKVVFVLVNLYSYVLFQSKAYQRL